METDKDKSFASQNYKKRKSSESYSSDVSYDKEKLSTSFLQKNKRKKISARFSLEKYRKKISSSETELSDFPKKENNAKTVVSNFSSESSSFPSQKNNRSAFIEGIFLLSTEICTCAVFIIAAVCCCEQNV